MARIFVAHQQEGAQSPLAGVADAIKEQRLMQEEQRRYEADVVFQQKKLAHQQERERAQDRMARQELAMRQRLSEAQAGYYEARGRAEEAEAAASALGVVPADPELESFRQSSLNGFIAQTDRLSSRVGTYQPGDKPPSDELLRRQQRYGAVRERMMAAQSEAELRQLQGQLDDLVTDDATYLDEWETDLTMGKLGADQQRLMATLDEDFLRTTGIEQREIDRITEATDKPQEIEEQNRQLRNLIENGKRYAAIDKVFTGWSSGEGEPGEAQAWALWSDKEKQDNPFGTEEAQDLLRVYQDARAPMAERVTAGNSILSFTAAQANPRTRGAIEGMQRVSGQLKARAAELESELDIAERLQQKGWPDYASVNSALDMLTEPSLDVVSANAKLLTGHLEEAWMEGTWTDKPRPIMSLLRDTKVRAMQSGMSAEEADAAIDEIQDALTSMTSGKLQPAFQSWIERAGQLPERQAPGFTDGTFADDPKRIKAERKFRGRR